MKRILLMCCLFIGVEATAQVKSTINPAEKARGLQKQLRLTNVQTSRIAAIYKESAQKFEKIKTVDHGNTNKMTVDVAPLRAVTIKKIKAVLTPREAVKYDRLVKETTTAGGSGWSDGWTAAAAN